MENETLTLAAAKAALTSITFFPVRLHYAGLTPPVKIEMKCKLALNEDDRAARQEFYSKPQGEIDKGYFAYCVAFLGRILVGPPTGLPGFVWPVPIPAEYIEGDDDGAGSTWKAPTLAETIADYFSSGEPMLEKIANDAVLEYFKVSQPSEFF